MKLALIPPVELLWHTERTHYQLMLPQLLNREAYFKHYQKLCWEPKQFVILDNGAAEGHNSTFDDLIRVARVFPVNEVVIPDEMGRMYDTVALAKEWGNKIKKANSWDRFNSMFVCQGQTFDEVIESIRWADSQNFIQTIGIPRHLITTIGDMAIRREIAHWINAEMPKRFNLHFLGANKQDPTEMSANAELEFVRGMDTSMPFAYAYYDKRLHYGEECDRPSDYFDIAREAFFADAVFENVEQVLEWAGDQDG